MAAVVAGVVDDELSSAVLRLLNDLGGRGEATHRDLETIRRRIDRRIDQRVRPRVPDRDELFSTTLAKFTAAVARGLVRTPPDGDPAGYLLRIADHLVADLKRSHHLRAVAEISSESPSPDEGPEEAVLRTLSRDSASLDVATLLRAVHDARDTNGTRVLAAYLDIAATNDVVSLRRVARAAGVSHPTVRHVLRRAATYFATGDWPSGRPRV